MQKWIKQAKFSMIGLIVVVIAIIAVITIAILTAAGTMFIGLKERDQVVTVTRNVCNRDIVDEYNEFAVGHTDITAFRELTKQIKDLNHHDEDPTCVAILLIYANFMNNTDDLNNWTTKLSNLNNQNLFPNNRILGDIIIDTTGDSNDDQLIEYITPEASSEGERNL
jgi:hypothetical protein